MSFSVVMFNIYYKGYWVKNHDGELAYIGGDVKFFECKPEEFFTNLMTEFGDELYGQNMWYKTCYADNTDRKSLNAGGASFSSMCEAGRWNGGIDVYMVDSTAHPNDEEIAEPCEAERRVQRNVAAFGEDDEDFDYHNTPPNSDGELEEDIVRYKKGSGELKLRQVFDSIEEFKEAVLEYALLNSRNVKLSRWGKVKSGARCAVESGNCPWYIYCSYEERLGKWMVKTYEDQHGCAKDSKCKMLKTAVIAKMFMEDIRDDPEYKPKTMQRQIEQRYSVLTSRNKCKKAKRRVLDIINAEHEEQFSRLKDYREALLRSNRGSTVELDTITNDDGAEIFRRFYVCFEVLRRQWSTWCRPIFGLDGCFLKSTLKGQLLAAVGRDANNGMYPIAWAVVDVEDEDNWTWFIRKLKADLNLGDGNRFTVISDRQKGLLNAVHNELPRVEHRMCARHIYGNLKKMFPRQSEMKKLFWQVAESYTMAEYTANLELVKSYDMRVYDAMMDKHPEHCSLAFFSPSASCVDVHNNISESFNNAIDSARYMPMVEMLETMRRGTMKRIDERRIKAMKYTSMFCPRPMEQINLEQKKVRFCKIFPGSDGTYEVIESGRAGTVDLDLRKCVCRRWDMSGLPCRHAQRVFAEKNLHHEEYTAHWYLSSRQQQIYSQSLPPVDGMFYWTNSESVVLPPPSLVEQIENRRGRTPKPKRKKAKHESPTKKKKVSREKRIMHCGRCGEAGHNIKKCPQQGPVPKPKPKKKQTQKKQTQKKQTQKKKTQASTASHNVSESMTLDYGEGPSQPTQE